MRTDERVDLPTRRASFEPPDDASILDQEQRRDHAHPEPLHESRAALDIDVYYSELTLPRHLDPGDEAVHAARQAASFASKEDERRQLPTGLFVVNTHAIGIPGRPGFQTGGFGLEAIGKTSETNLPCTIDRGGDACRTAPFARR